MTEFSADEGRRRFLARMKVNRPLIEKAGNVGELRGSFSGRPAIIVGAGPSLEKNIALLKEAGTAAIFACDRAHGPLADAGVAPDYVVTCDPTDAVGGFIRPERAAGETLLASAYAAEKILEHPWKRILFYNTADDDRAYMKESAAICPGLPLIPGSLLVSNFAFLLAELAGCGPVCFVGVDFCAPEPEPSWLAPGVGYVELKLADGRRFHTLKTFILALDWMESYLAGREAAGAPVQTFNCTEGGMFYSNRLLPLPLRDFLERFCR